MRLSELIEELQEALETYGDLQVMTSSDYGDITHTEQLAEIADVVPCVPVETAYSQSGLAFPRGEDDDDDEMDIDQETEQIMEIENELHGNKVLVLRHTC